MKLSVSVYMIQALAKEVYKDLLSNKITKARREIKAIVDLDLAEIRKLEFDHGDQRVLRECYIVLHDARKLLEWSFGDRIYIYSKFEKVNKAKKLVESIRRITKNEVKEIEEDQEKIEIFKDCWENNLNSRFIYHGTNSAALAKIRRYGLVPGMKVYNERDVQELVALFRKAGSSFTSGDIYKNQKGKWIYYTGIKSEAEDYARRIAEFWSYIVDINGKGPVNYKYARRTVCLRLIGVEYDRKKEISDNQLLDYVKANSILKRKEINYALKCFERLWKVLGDSKPVVLHISIKCPALLEKIFLYGKKNILDNFLFSFSRYLIVYQNFPDSKSNYFLIPTERIETMVNDFFLTRMGLRSTVVSHNFSINKRIPAKYIVKYEYI